MCCIVESSYALADLRDAGDALQRYSHDASVPITPASGQPQVNQVQEGWAPRCHSFALILFTTKAVCFRYANMNITNNDTMRMVAFQSLKNENLASILV